MKETGIDRIKTPRGVVNWIRRNVPPWEETTCEAERSMILLADRLDYLLKGRKGANGKK